VQQRPLTEHVKVAAEMLSFKRIMNTVRRCCGISVILMLSTNLTTYLLTYLQTILNILFRNLL